MRTDNTGDPDPTPQPDGQYVTRQQLAANAAGIFWAGLFPGTSKGQEAAVRVAARAKAHAEHQAKLDAEYEAALAPLPQHLRALVVHLADNDRGEVLLIAPRVVGALQSDGLLPLPPAPRTFNGPTVNGVPTNCNPGH